MNDSKVILVTGGSSGIGRAVVLESMKLGWMVAFTGRSDNHIDSVTKELDANFPSKRGHFLAIKANFEDPEQVELIIDKTISKFGRLNILVNNAGYIGKQRHIQDDDFFEDFQNIMQVNLSAPVRLSQLATPHLAKEKGVIINISSIADRVALDSISYSISKAGLSMLTKTLANALESKGVRSVGIAPGPTKTNFVPGLKHAGYMTSVNRTAESQEIANLIMFVASDKASFIQGSILDIDGGCYTKCNGAFRPPKLLRMLQ